MRTPSRRRPRPGELVQPPDGIDLISIAPEASYVGSAEHKNYPSFAGPPKLRSDASRCDPTLGTPDDFTEWLRLGIEAGHVGAPWEGSFPRYVWYRHDEICYEARLVNRVSGDCKGYPLSEQECPVDI
jgi:hypothetical protein